ncbi:hypothetical protein F5J12DRAFT_895300 [Pisolithus orientalis]|uniref:uncharacterized protein n=1 Tax=Pisolithus orientalis TaxID=936130 RepID=UPI002224E2EF|nr:uncharacterized protein F5J12DRAFT_895300 [Pisolithus orientalis]KAI5998909.1 hypothetical protein F5J12DRAFT_895300 [Pisolithus orientalis]
MSTLVGTVKIAGDIEFFYGDSGFNGLDPTNYTTVGFIHDMGFNGAVFRKLFPFGTEHNYRVVSLYRRGVWIHSDNNDHKEYLHLACLQIVRFLVTFIASQSIPKYANEQKTGGTILIGWSLVLYSPDALTTEELRDLESYLHTVVYYGN